MTGAISQDWESCQFPFVLDEKSAIVPIGSAGERPEARTGSLWRRSVELRVSRAVGLRWQRFSAVTLFGIDRLDEPGHAAGRGMIDPGVIGLSLGSRRVTCGGTGMDRPR